MYERLVKTMKVAGVVMILMKLDKRIQREVRIIANRWSMKREDRYSIRFITTAFMFVRKSGRVQALLTWNTPISVPKFVPVLSPCSLLLYHFFLFPHLYRDYSEAKGDVDMALK